MDSIEPRKYLTTLRHDSRRLRVWVVFYLIAIALVTSLIFWDSQHRFDQQIKRQLLLGAQAVPSVLPPDYHDRATQPDAISREEFITQVRRLSDLAETNEFRYLYTLIQLNGRIYFTAYNITFTEGNRTGTNNYYFLPYPDAPPELLQAFKTRTLTYARYTDHWGSFSSAFRPAQSPAGNWYVIGADYDLHQIHRSLLFRLLFSLAIGLLAGLATIPILLSQHKDSKTHTQALREWTETLAREVDRRTAELSQEIAERKLSENRQRFNIRILTRLQQSEPDPFLIRDILLLIRDYTGLEHVGIRLREGLKYPFYRLPSGDCASERTDGLILDLTKEAQCPIDATGHFPLACLCGAVIECRTDPTQSYVTPKGSFFTSNFSEIYDRIRQAPDAPPLRSHCFNQDIQTFGLIPLSDGSCSRGLLHLSDTRPQRLRMEDFYFLENIGFTLGMALHRKQLELDLTVSREKYRLLFTSMTSAFALHEIIFDDRGDPADYRFIDANPVFCKMLGIAHDQLIGQTAKTLFPKIDPDWISIYADVALTGAPRNFEKYFALLDKTFDIHAFRPQPRQFAVIAKDITEQSQTRLKLEVSHKKLEQALTDLRQAQKIIVQQERLAALGHLVSGLSHDFNNCLMPIRGLSQFLLDTPDLMQKPAELQQIVGIIATAGRDAAAIVRRLKDIFEPQPDLQITSIETEFLLDDVLASARPRWELSSPPIPIETQIAISHLDSFRGDEIQIREVLLNLILNAIDAMPQGGKLTLSAKRQNNQAVLSVIDTGIGMTPEVREKCMDPFFTTKQGRGSGVGLSMAQQIIIRHGGEIECDSTPGHGTTFRLLLPLDTLLPLPAKAEPVVPPSIPRPLKILVIDDDPITNEVLDHFLSREGHEVTCITQPLKISEQFQKTAFDLVITDRIMPLFSGEEVIQWIKAHHPKCPVILITGLPPSSLLTHHDPTGADISLEKPITAKQLMDAIAWVLFKKQE